jgi:hypothetical protein
LKKQNAKKQADKHAISNKIVEGKQHRKNTNGNVQSVTTWKKGRKAVKQNPSDIRK